VIYTAQELTRKEVTKLKRYAKTIVVKDARSPERLLDETALFLHRSQASLPDCSARCWKRSTRLDGGLAGRKVLIVDDDLRNIFALSSLLERQQMQVLFAENGRDGIEVLEKDPGIEIVLMDIMMPEMDGYDTMRAIRRIPKFKSLPIITLTAKAMKGDRDKCIAAGASDYITKPVDVAQLLSHDAGVAALMAWTGLAAAVAVEELETELLLEALFQRFGYDFRAYDRAALRARLARAHARARNWAPCPAAGAGAARCGRRPRSCCARWRGKPSPCSTIPATRRAAHGAGAVAARLAVPRVWLAECAGVGEAWTLAIVLAEEGCWAAEIHATLANEELVAAVRTPGCRWPSWRRRRSASSKAAGAAPCRPGSRSATAARACCRAAPAHHLVAIQPGDGRLVQRVPGHRLLPARWPTSARCCASACCACSTTAWRGSGCCAWTGLYR
jgi:CheY-like chemotaxis protein